MCSRCTSGGVMSPRPASSYWKPVALVLVIFYVALTFFTLGHLSSPMSQLHYVKDALYVREGRRLPGAQGAAPAPPCEQQQQLKRAAPNAWPQLPQWTPVTEDDLMVYSAHWETRDLHGLQAPYVKLLATSITTIQQQGNYPAPEDEMAKYSKLDIQCSFMFEDGTRETVTAGLDLASRQGTRGNFFILCPASQLLEGKRPEQAPNMVSLQCERCESQWAIEIMDGKALRKLKKLQAPPPTDTETSSASPPAEDEATPQRGKLAVCVRPVYGPMDYPVDLVQFLLYYLVVGAEHFTFYNPRGFAPSMLRVLRKAEELGVSFEVLPWNLWYSHTGARLLHEYGQHTSINACLYWNLQRYEYVAVVDMDELISARSHDTLTGLLARLDADNPTAGGYTFLNNFFSRNEGLDPELQAGHALPFDMFHVSQRRGPYDAWSRAKVIAKTDRVVELVTHAIGELVPNYGSVTVPDDQAGIYHYRIEPQIDSHVSVQRDTGMLKYYDRIAKHPMLQELMRAATNDPEWTLKEKEVDEGTTAAALKTK